MKKLFLFVTLSMLFFGASAQKFGYLNSEAILVEMSDVKAANSTIQTFQEQLAKQGRAKAEALQARYQKLAEDEKKGLLSPKQLQDEGGKLKADEEALGKEEQEMMQKVGAKREELLKPILDRVNKAISDVAKESGYAYIFDSNAGVLLYADEKSNVTDIVKAKLGMPLTVPAGK
jgi:outer membrane protein